MGEIGYDAPGAYRAPGATRTAGSYRNRGGARATIGDRQRGRFAPVHTREQFAAQAQRDFGPRHLTGAALAATLEREAQRALTRPQLSDGVTAWRGKACAGCGTQRALSGACACRASERAQDARRAAPGETRPAPCADCVRKWGLPMCVCGA